MDNEIETKAFIVNQEKNSILTTKIRTHVLTVTNSINIQENRTGVGGGGSAG
jgi:hypothetical protein